MSKTTDRAPARRPRRSSEDLLTQILAAAELEFRRGGYGGATTAAIARRADVTEAQLFRCFASKADLFREAVFKPLDQRFEAFLESHMADPDAETLRRSTGAYIDELQTFIAEHAEHLTSLFVLQTYDPEALKGVSTAGSLASYFERGAALMTKRLTGPAKVDPKLMVRVSFGAVLGCILFADWIFPPGLAGEDDIQAAIKAFVQEGVSANADMGPLQA